MERLTVAVLAGGRSAEHDISRLSALSVVEALDDDKYEPLAVLIEPSGDWRLTRPDKLALPGAPEPAADDDGRTGTRGSLEARPATVTSPSKALRGIDVIFPVLHGEFGEDGSIQGLFETIDLPYVGAGVLASALGLDKAMFKAVLRDAQIPVAPGAVAHKTRTEIDSFIDNVLSAYGTPLFVKPARQGSSIGISKATSRDELAEALQVAFQHDDKVVVEQAIEGVEVEVGVLGNDDPIVSVPGEVRIAPDGTWYDFETKYTDGMVDLVVPADISDEASDRVRALALEVYQAIDCEGLARVDCFVQPDGNVVVNEINTMPGFTAHSAFPKLFEASGVSYNELVDRLIQLAMDRHRERSDA